MIKTDTEMATLIPVNIKDKSITATTALEHIELKHEWTHLYLFIYRIYFGRNVVELYF